MNEGYITNMHLHMYMFIFDAKRVHMHEVECMFSRAAGEGLDGMSMPLCSSRIMRKGQVSPV